MATPSRFADLFWQEIDGLVEEKDFEITQLIQFISSWCSYLI